MSPIVLLLIVFGTLGSARQVPFPKASTPAPQDPAAPNAPQDPAAPPAPPTPTTPSKPAASTVPKEPAKKPAFTTAWTFPIAADGPLTLTLTPTLVVIAGAETATEARSLADGQVAWMSTDRLRRPPVVLGDRLFGVAENRLIALNVADGTPAWSVDLAGETPGPVATPEAILMSEGAWLRAYRPLDGALLWQQDAGAPARVRMATEASVIVVPLEDQTLAAFDKASGRPLWREPAAITVTSVLVSGDRVYLGGAEGFACAHKLEHGRQDWCFRVRVTPIGTPVTDARYVYFTFLDNMVHVFDRENGRRFFTPSLGALPSDGPTLTQDAVIVPIVTGEFVLLNPRDRFSATRVSSPRVAELPSTRAAAVAPDGGTLVMVVASPGGRSLMCFRRTTPDATPKTDGTAPDTPTTPPAP